MHLGKKVIHDSAHSLLALHREFPDSFQDVVSFLSTVNGKVICIGMGKSHHVAKKVAATLSSTGTSAFCVHPADSMHGDLGMIQKNDAVLLFSLSGETNESIQLLKHSPTPATIAITAKPSSTIATLSKWVLKIPDYPESCLLGLAPTTSCLMMMALGDALAMALLSQKNFSKQDFRAFHPSGSLGYSLKTVEQVMHKPAPVFSENTSLGAILTQWIGLSAPIVGLINDDGLLTATITAQEVQEWQSHCDLSSLACSQIPTLNRTLQNQVVSETVLWMDAVKKMNTHHHHAMLVTNANGRPVGWVHDDHYGTRP